MTNNLEKYSSAFTLSDMEIFIYPELFYSLVLANIMSPAIWKWKDDPWFKDVHKKSFTYKMNRIKQYIMDHYVFNLDLETWGLTDKKTEIDRFSNSIDPDLLKQSNALFGYEGDKYYFSMDIRRHFGLEKYHDDIIPYWKTETVEAMDAFSHKEGYSCGAGECVSLSSLYAAALFVVGNIPLEKMFLIATPLHSQNFINEKTGVITNNRRIVTKNMWFNGTELSAKARRALENEKVTIVSHLTGYIHTLYKEATISPDEYKRFELSLRKFLHSEFEPNVFINFLRTKRDSWKCFQFRYKINNRELYIGLETIFKYEHGSKNSFSGDSRNALLNEIDPQEFSFSKYGSKIVVNDLEEFLNKNMSLSYEEKEQYIFDNLFPHKCSAMRLFFMEFKEFLEIHPRLPEKDKNFIQTDRISILPNQTREEIVDHLFLKAGTNEVAKLAFYAFRDMTCTDWQPYIYAAIKRNPVCNAGLTGLTAEEAYNKLQSFGNKSIYELNRLAMPDEVWNFETGDGIEKAVALLNYLVKVNPEKEISVSVTPDEVILEFASYRFSFNTGKELKKRISVCNGEILID